MTRRRKRRRTGRRSTTHRHVLRAIIIVIGASIATAIIAHFGWLDRFETTSLDAFNILQTVHDPQNVVVIGITEEDYANKELFNSTSPLRCDVVLKVIDAVASGGPAVIGVDLDTSAWTKECVAGIADGWPPIVWARDAVWNAQRHVFTEAGVLGQIGLRRSIDRTGLVQMPVDPDGKIRHFYRTLPVDKVRADTFPLALIMASKASVGANRPEDGAILLHFAGERFNFQPLPVSRVLAVAGFEAWRTNGPLTGRIVLIGGFYGPARDTHQTPVGPMSGVQILAQAIESELRGGIRGLDEALAFGLDLSVGLLLVWVNYRLRRRPVVALAATTVFTPFACLAASLAAFSTLALWVNFVPVVVSVFGHEIYEHTREYQRLRREHRHEA